jgi:ABC-type dipeptide/oligopeptide/nickel transport system permease subunit
MRTFRYTILKDKDSLWTLFWLGGLLVIWIWNKLFLNAPALRQIEFAFLNTIVVALVVIIFALLLAWLTTLALHYTERKNLRYIHLSVTFLLNIVRSIPQIIGILLGYIIMTGYIEQGTLSSSFAMLLVMAFIISIFVFYEIVDMLRERIAYYRTLDYYNAMLVCGIKESRIINHEIILKNSLAHLLNKLIYLFGITIFLQCSVDFIISIGLTQEASSVNFPYTLGSLLAKIDSKQDILAIGYTMTNPGYGTNLFFQHLQGITIAFSIIFSLLCIYHIANNYAERKQI